MGLAEHICTLEANLGFRVSLATSHPAVIHACRKSSRWRFFGIKRCGGTPQCIRGRRLAGSTGRIVAAFEFNAECGVRNAESERDESRNVRASTARNPQSEICNQPLSTLHSALRIPHSAFD
jgi:hypothetical protein